MLINIILRSENPYYNHHSCESSFDFNSMFVNFFATTRFTSEENCLFISSKLQRDARTPVESVYSVKRYNLCPESQMRRLWFCFDSTTEKNRSFFKFPSNIQTREYFKTFLQATNLMMNRYYVTSNESTSKNAGSSFFFLLFFFSINTSESEIGSWKLEFPLTFFA